MPQRIVTSTSSRVRSKQAAGAYEEIRLLGSRVHKLTSADLVDSIEAAMIERRRLVVGNHNVHSLALLQDDERFKRFYDASDIIFIDGMPVVMMTRILGYAVGRQHRMTSLDFFGEILTRCVRHRHRVFYLGSAPGVIERGAARFLEMAPGLQLAFHHGHFDADPSGAEAKSVLAQINAFAPDLLVVGMGMPRQEYWVLDNMDHLDASVLFPIGALADYHARAIPTPPRWAGRLGLEWMFRLLAEPRRLGHRYLIEPWRLLRPLMRDVHRR